MVFLSFSRSLKSTATRARVGNNERRVPRVLIAWSGLVRMAVKGTARSALGHPQSILKPRPRVGMYARTGYAHACVCIFICMFISPFLSRSLFCAIPRCYPPISSHDLRVYWVSEKKGRRNVFHHFQFPILLCIRFLCFQG